VKGWISRRSIGAVGIAVAGAVAGAVPWMMSPATEPPQIQEDPDIGEVRCPAVSTATGLWTVLVDGDTVSSHTRQDKAFESAVEQAEMALRLWSRLGLSNVHVVAHDYGTSVLTEILARDQFQKLDVTLESITLCNGSVHIELSELRVLQLLLRRPYLGPMVAKLSRYGLFRRNMARIWGDSARLDEATVAAMWEGLIARSGREVLAKVSRYTLERSHFWYRWIGALRETAIPAHILWGDQDPVAVPAIARALKEDMPHARLEWLEGVGHYPMLEATEQWSAMVTDFIKGTAHS